MERALSLRPARHIGKHTDPHRARIGRPWTRVFAGLFLALSAARQRRRLGQLGDRLLNDIGLDRPTAEAEAARPLWDVPSHWRR